MASVSFGSVNPGLIADLEKTFGKPAAFRDMYNALFDQVDTIDRATMGKLANEHKQPITANIHVPGETVKMSDGTEYVVAADGSWRKVDKEGGE
ncbi:MAG: hypothetical protein AB1805_07465 [Nitrospirota bacterium]